MTVFSVWAPAASQVEVEVAGRRHQMEPGDRSGWWRVEADAPPGTDYAFRLDGGEPLADPRSLRQPYGPAGPSRTYSHDDFEWTDARWRGAPLPGAVIYELHVGTFTPEGTLDAAIGRLDYLAGLGVTAVEPEGVIGSRRRVRLRPPPAGTVARLHLVAPAGNLRLDPVRRGRPHVEGGHGSSGTSSATGSRRVSSASGT